MRHSTTSSGTRERLIPDLPFRFLRRWASSEKLLWRASIQHPTNLSSVKETPAVVGSGHRSAKTTSKRHTSVVRVGRTAVTITAGLCLLLAGCSKGADQPTVTPATSGSSTAVTTPTEDSGLVAAQHPHCDVGQKILRYLRTGDNGGDPELDREFANYVGVPTPQGRALADSYIVKCDQLLAQQEAAQASASAQAATSIAAAATEAQQKAQEEAQQQLSCTKLGGRVDVLGCTSTVPGNPSGRAGAVCVNAHAAFNQDGTIADWSYATAKDFYPGCFK